MNTMVAYMLIKVRSGVLEECLCYLDYPDVRAEYQAAEEEAGSNTDLVLVKCRIPDQARAGIGEVIAESYSA